MEKTKICKYCKSEMNSKAVICPQCGKKQKSKLKFILIGLVALIIIIAIASGGENNTNEPSASDIEVQESTANEETVTKEPVVEEKTTFNVGEIAENNNIKISYLSAEEYTEYDSFSAPKEGYTYYRVGFEVENKGSSDLYVSDFEFVGYADGYAVDQTIYFYDGGLTATLSTGKKAQGYVYYEVPQNASSITIEYETSFWTNKKIIFIIK